MLLAERTKNPGKESMLIHAYRLIYPDSPHAPTMLWEWERPSIDRLLWNARTFGREVVQRYFLTWEALVQENQGIWETDYRPRPLYEPWETWRAWLDESRELVQEVQDIYEEHNGRIHKALSQVHQTGQCSGSKPHITGA